MKTPINPRDSKIFQRPGEHGHVSGADGHAGGSAAGEIFSLGDPMMDRGSMSGKHHPTPDANHGAAEYLPTFIWATYLG